MSGALVGAIVGGAAFLLVFGPQLLDPANIGWLMRHDSQTYYLAFEHFRREPWQWPPGAIAGIGHPVGTSIGNTDAVPLVALPLKLLHGWLGTPFQFLGWWLLACWTLQGLFGALLVRQVTARPVLQVLGAALFVLTPALLHRTGHAALCAHWTWLAALWLLLGRAAPGQATRRWPWIALSAVTAAVQPYLAVVVTGLAVCVALDEVRWSRDASGRVQALAFGTGAASAALLTLWVDGIFLVPAGDLQRGGLGEFSMNLLAPIAPLGFSAWLPEVPLARAGQYEGFVYFGLGWLALSTLGLVLRLRSGRPVLPPLGLARVLVLGCLLMAIGPVVAAGSRVLLDLSAWTPAVLETFRSSGRFGWLPMYLAFAAAVRAVVTRLPPRTATAVLAVALTLQGLDLRGAYAGVYARERSAAWTSYANPLRHPAWAIAAAQYRHLVMVPPDMCVSVWPGAVGDHLPFSMLAAHHGATINSGNAGRYDVGAVGRYCAALERDLRGGVLADDSLYVLNPAMRAVVDAAARQPTACGRLDGLDVCVTAASYARWREAGSRAGLDLASVPGR